MGIKKIFSSFFLASLSLFSAFVFARPTESSFSVIPADQIQFTPMDSKLGEKGPQISVVFGDLKEKGPVGLFLKVPAGFRPGLHSHTSDYYGVAIRGSSHHFLAGGNEGLAVTAGGTWMQKGGNVHDDYCEEQSECLFFIHSPKGFDFIPQSQPAKKNRK